MRGSQNQAQPAAVFCPSSLPRPGSLGLSHGRGEHSSRDSSRPVRGRRGDLCEVPAEIPGEVDPEEEQELLDLPALLPPLLFRLEPEAAGRL